MKTIFKFIVTLVVFTVAVFIWQSCCDCPDFKFAGKVVDITGKGIAEAVVKVGEKEEKTNRDGEFEISVVQTGRYVFNVSKLGFGFASKIYRDTASNLLITLAKATVVTIKSNQAITIQDIRPDISYPGGEPQAPQTALDTIPFKYDSRGNLIGFSKPGSMIDIEKALTKFKPPVLGAKIEIPADAFVIKGTNRKVEGEIQVSLNTVDIYSPDGMPGDYTVNLGKQGLAYMIPYGAANVEAYYNNEPLQLSPDKRAILTIPVDTLSILNGDLLPDEIPLMVYNDTTGYWQVDGVAKLNDAKTAYTRPVKHFTTFNMDAWKTPPSCVQLCKDITAGYTLRITATDGTKTVVKTMPRSSVLCTGTSRCTGYSSPVTGSSLLVGSTNGIINLPQNKDVKVEVLNTSSAVVSTYSLNTGVAVTSPVQVCGFDACAGPFLVTDVIRGWEKTTAGAGNGTMTGPIVAMEPLGGTSYKISILYIENYNVGTGAISMTAGTKYQVQYKLVDYGLGSTYSHAETGWTGPLRFSGVTDLDPAGNHYFTANVDFSAAGQPTAVTFGSQVFLFLRVIKSTTGTFTPTTNEPVYGYSLDPTASSDFHGSSSITVN